MSKLLIDDSVMREFYWIRHPKTVVGNTICYGSTDYGVAEDVMQETACSVISRLEGLKPDRCYASPLSRAKVLASRLFPSQEIFVREEVKEINFGQWEGLSWDKIPEEKQLEWSRNILNFKEHGGENFKDLQARVVPFWEQLLASDDERVVIVAHAGVIVSLLSHLLEASPSNVFRLDIDFGSIVKIRVRDDGFIKIKMM